MCDVFWPFVSGVTAALRPWIFGVLFNYLIAHLGFFFKYYFFIIIIMFFLSDAMRYGGTMISNGVTASHQIRGSPTWNIAPILRLGD